MITMLKLHRHRQVGDDWFGKHPPGRELATLEREQESYRYQWSLRDDGRVWMRATESRAVSGQWRKLGVHWTVIAVLTAAQMRDARDVPEVVLLEVAQAQAASG